MIRQTVGDFAEAPPYGSIREFLDARAKNSPDKTAICEPESDFGLTYEELTINARSVTVWLASLGLRKGDKLAIAAGNSLAAIQLLSGALYGQYVPVCCNPDLGPGQLSFVLDHCDADLVFVSPENRSALELALEACPRPIKLIEVDRLLQLTPSDGKTTAAEPADDALIVYTSGTTGMPKGVLHSRAGQLAGIEATALTYDLSEADRFLCVLPIHHANSINKLFATWLTGGTVILPLRFEVRRFWNWVDHHQCTWLSIVPSIISQLLRFSAKGSHPSVRFARSSSAPLPVSWHRDFEERFGIPLMQGMGSTETGPLFNNPLPPAPRKMGSPGKSVVRQMVRIVDQNGNDLEDYETGFIVAGGPSRMKGYYKEPEATLEALTPDGWIRTGDIGHRDSEGFFFVTGRAKEIVIKAGVNISLREIDETLLSHPAIIDAASTGIEDDLLGEDLLAYVVLEPHCNTGESEFLDFCSEKLGAFKTPAHMILVAEIPRLPNGKVQRHLLRERFGPATLPPASRPPRPMRTGQPFVAPRTPIEAIIAGIWTKYLDQETVGVYDDFFALGGYSILAIRMLTPLRKALGTTLSLTSFFDYPTIVEQVIHVVDQAMEGLPESKRLDSLNSIEQRHAGEEGNGTSEWVNGKTLQGLKLESRIQLESALLRELTGNYPDDQIPRRPPAELCPLSFAQQRIWFLSQLTPESSMYHIGDAIRLRGSLNIEALEEALNKLVDRHEILRVSVHVIDGQPWQQFRDHLPIRIKRETLENLPESQKESVLQQIILSESQRPYLLEKDPLIRAAVVRMDQHDHVFILCFHHLVKDGWSNRILFKDLQVFYNDRIHCRNTTLPPLSIQYADFTIWQRKRLDGETIKRESAYWSTRLKGVPTLLDLPTDHPRSKVLTHRGHRLEFSLSESTSEQVLKASKHMQVSPFTTLSAAFASLLYRYSGQKDFLVGLPFADRDRQEIQNMVGLLLDTHIIRFSLSRGISFQELTRQTRREIADSYARRQLPFELVVTAVHPERSLSHMPLCQVMVNWREPGTRISSLELEGLSTQDLLAHDRSAKFDLSITFCDSKAGIEFEIEYNSDLFEAETIRRLAGNYQQLLVAATTDPSCSISQLPLLTECERHRILWEWNDTAADYPQDRCIHQLFEDQVERTPEAIALVFEDREISYAELNARANRLAHHLMDLGVGPEILVGIYLERSLEMVVGLLAIHKSGGAYLPLDPNYPQIRLMQYLDYAEANFLITRKSLESDLTNFKGTVVNIDDLVTDGGKQANPTAKVQSNHLAYIQFTSGSTGIPKGVQIEHRSVVNLLESLAREPGLTRTDTLLSVTSLSFDISVMEIFLPLIKGARLVLASSEETRDSHRLSERIEHSGATVMAATPVTWTLLLESNWPGSKELSVWCGGEAMTPILRDSLVDKCKSLWNLYGPTETTVFSTAGEMNQGPVSVAIGRPIANTRTYILNTEREPVPVGIPGELYIGGAGLARGYLNQNALTEAMFIPDPFSEEPGARMYRTGDQVRYLPEGDIEFIGRLDDQIKIRGFRIEPGEIETMLCRDPAVNQAVVVAREDSPGDKRLVAYLAMDDEAREYTAALRTYINERLPDYMVPSIFVVVEQLPFTPNGKVDRQALPPPPGDENRHDPQHLPPRSELEKQVASVWCEVLKRKQVGIHDNFFELGGHSLLAMKIVARLQSKGIERATLRSIFETPTVAGFAASLKKP